MYNDTINLHFATPPRSLEPSSTLFGVFLVRSRTNGQLHGHFSTECFFYDALLFDADLTGGGRCAGGVESSPRKKASRRLARTLSFAANFQKLQSGGCRWQGAVYFAGERAFCATRISPIRRIRDPTSNPCATRAMHNVKVPPRFLFMFTFFNVYFATCYFSTYVKK